MESERSFHQLDHSTAIETSDYHSAGGDVGGVGGGGGAAVSKEIFFGPSGLSLV